MRSKNTIRKKYFSTPKSREKVWGVNVLWDFFSIPKYIALLDRLKKTEECKNTKNVWGGKSMRRKRLWMPNRLKDFKNYSKGCQLEFTTLEKGMPTRVHNARKVEKGMPT